MSDLPEPVPAATLILMRPASSADAPPELLMIERAGHMAFAAGALVFPGGRIDPDDDVAAALIPDPPEDGAARIAAIRETIEETGLLPAMPAGTESATIRARLVAGEAFSALLAELGASPDFEALMPFARWCPNFRETRRFDTLFYLAEAPEGAKASADDTESVRTLWASAGDILAEIASGAAHAIFPTMRNLERLARFATIEEARADALRHPVRKITPWVEERGGEPWVCIPEDAGYPVTAERLETARRR